MWKNVYYQIDFITFKIVSLGIYTLMKTLFVGAETVLEVFNWYSFQLTDWLILMACMMLHEGAKDDGLVLKLTVNWVKLSLGSSFSWPFDRLV